MKVHLSRELREKHGKRAVPLKVGDKVRVKAGDFKGTIGKVLSVERKRGYVHVEEATRQKVDGSKVPANIHFSNLEIIELDMSDPWRKKILER